MGSQIHPNTSKVWDSFEDIADCGVTEEKCGCLFDVLKDPEERVDLATIMPTKAREIYGTCSIIMPAMFTRAI